MNSVGLVLIKSKKSFRTKTILSADWGQINQLLHRIRLRRCTPQALLANNFVRETDWQKEDTLIAQVDLNAHNWDTNFGWSPFDAEHEE